MEAGTDAALRERSVDDAVVTELGEETGGRLDLLYNNAGIGAAGYFGLKVLTE